MRIHFHFHLNLTQLKTWSWSGRIARRRTDIATATSLEDPTHASVERDFDWCLRALCHRRRTVEPLIQISALNPMIAGDSVFGHPCVNISLEPVRGRSERSGGFRSRTWRTNRGAWQGDVLGAIQSAIVLGTSLEVHMRDYLFPSPFSKKGACDECYASRRTRLCQARSV